MKENNTCKCPLCKQKFLPENGLTPEEHIAKGIIKAYKEMQDTQHNLELPCPRCGSKQPKPVISDNAISSHINAYICNGCIIDELKRNKEDNNLPVTDWYIVHEILTSIKGTKCANYIPEKDNPYPLCDNPACEKSTVCNISMYLTDDGGYSKYDK